MSFKLSMVVQSNFSGEQRPEASYFKLRKTPSTLNLHREVLEGPVVLPGEPPSAGVLPAHTPHRRSVYTEKLQPREAGVYVHVGEEENGLSEVLVVAPLSLFLDIDWSFASTVWVHSECNS